MSIEARAPPSQFVFKLKRVLGGKSGWSGFAYQLLFVAALVWIVFEIIANARANLATQRITTGFGFLDQTAGFDVSQDALHSSSHFGVIGSMGGGALAAFEVANQTILLIGQFPSHGDVAC